MEFTAHIPDLDGVGGTIILWCRGGGGPDRFHLTMGPEVVWDVDRSNPPPDLQENLRRQQVVQDAAAVYIDAAGNLPFVYDPNAADHLRIYGLDRTPVNLVGQYLAHRPPTEYDFGLLGLQKAAVHGATDQGDIPDMLYTDNGTEICRRQFAFAYSTDANGATILTVTETPQWARNDGAWVSGPTKTQVYSGQRYNAWRDSARQRIFEWLKTWLPITLVALEEAMDVPAGEALSGGWLATNHAAPWQHYLSSGRKELITQTLTDDTTTWLDSVVPDNTVPGLASGKTVREMILEALR